LTKIAKNSKHTDKDFATEYLTKLDASNKRDVKMKDVPSTITATVAAQPTTSDGSKSYTAPMSKPDIVKPAISPLANMGSTDTVKSTVAPVPQAAPAPLVAPANISPVETIKRAPTISTVSEVQTRLVTLEAEAQTLADSGADDEKLEKIEGQIAATKRRLASLQK
jgi:hypothetical protein